MISGGRLASFVELLQGAFPDCCSQRPGSGRPHPTPIRTLLPRSLALFFRTSLGIFPGQGPGLPLHCGTPPPTFRLGIAQSSSAIREEPLCLLSGGQGQWKPDGWPWGALPPRRRCKFASPVFASLFRDFPFPG